MARRCHYALAVWLRLEVAGNALDLEDELRDYLGAKYQVMKMEFIEESEQESEDEVTVSLQLQLTFAEAQMDADEPTADALAELDQELRSHLEAKYHLNYMDLLDDSFGSYLLAEWDNNESPE
jgi:hypothetical protein